MRKGMLSGLWSLKWVLLCLLLTGCPKSDPPTPTPTRDPLYFQVQKVDVGEPTCSTIGSIVTVVLNPATLLNINIGDYVHLSGGGYVGCWEVTNTGTSPSFTNITAKFTNCDCI